MQHRPSVSSAKAMGEARLVLGEIDPEKTQLLALPQRPSPRTLCAVYRLGLSLEELARPAAEPAADDENGQMEETRRRRLVSEVFAERERLASRHDGPATVWQTERAVGLVSDLDRCQCTPLVAARQKAVRALSASRGRRVAPPKDESATMRRPASAGALQRSSSKKEVVRDEDGYARLAKFQEKAREDVRQMIEAEVRKVEMQVKARERDAVMEEKRKAVMKEMEERRVLALKQLAIAQNKREEKAKRAEAEKKEIQAVRAAKALIR